MMKIEFLHSLEAFSPPDKVNLLYGIPNIFNSSSVFKRTKYSNSLSFNNISSSELYNLFIEQYSKIAP